MNVLYQAEPSECGLVSLAMIADHYNYKIDLVTLRYRFPVSIKGTTLNYVIDIAQRLKLNTRAIRCELSELKELQLPAILHWELDHFVVIKRIKGSKYEIYDPAMGRLVLKEDEVSKKFTGVALEIWPSAEFKPENIRNRLKIRSIIGDIGYLKKPLALIFFQALFIEFSILSAPIIQQIIIDDVLITKDIDLLKLLAIVLMVTLLSQTITTAIRSITQRKLSSKISIMIHTDVFKHMLGLPNYWFKKRTAAEIANRFESCNAIQKIVTETIITSGIDGVVTCLALILMFTYSPKLSAIVVIMLLLYVAVKIVRYESYKINAQGALVAASNAQAHIWETVAGIATIKAFNGEKWKNNQYVNKIARMVKIQNNLAMGDVCFVFFHDAIFALEKVIILYLAAQAVINNQFTIGMATAFFSIKENLISKGSSLVDSYFNYKMLAIHLDRISDIALTKIDKGQELPYLGSIDLDNCISVKKISFRYGENEKFIIKDCSFQIKNGETLAIIGASGSGKSTLFNILIGNQKPFSGDILFGNQSLLSFNLTEFRSLIAVVQQSDILFSGTILENVAFVSSTPDLVQAEEVCRMVNIYDDIKSMPMGFNTIIGNFGAGLSGGQVQRIMLARALYKNPKILFLDEATSNLDVKTEASIIEILKNIKITKVIIAHRPETISMADRVLSMDEINNV